MNKEKRTAIFNRLRDENPTPTTELKHHSTFELLISVILSAQATDVGVNKATGALFAAADHPAKMLALGESRLKELIKTIGLFNTKAKNIIGLSHMLVDGHGGEVPGDRAALEALP
ncbi:MAG: endonuclease III, partial [Pseudomonadales bacterium]|nr:endonuclease III [Pseudomonadales bacterium]